MTKITIPVDSAKSGGNLYTLVDDLTNLNSEVSKTRDNGNLIINDNAASSEQKIIIDQATLLSILAEGGEVTEYLMGIRMPSTFSATDVPAGLPWRVNVLGTTRRFRDWFLDGAEVWIKVGGDEFLFYTNPAAGLASPSEYLTGSQMEIIRQLNTVTITILTVSEVQTLVASGWNKVVW